MQCAHALRLLLQMARRLSSLKNSFSLLKCGAIRCESCHLGPSLELPIRRRATRILTDNILRQHRRVEYLDAVVGLGFALSFPERT